MIPVNSLDNEVYAGIWEVEPIASIEPGEGVGSTGEEGRTPSDNEAFSSGPRVHSSRENPMASAEQVDTDLIPTPIAGPGRGMVPLTHHCRAQPRPLT